MPVDFDFSDVPESFDAGFDNAGPGSYHFRVAELDEGEPGGKSMMVDLEVLAGNPISEVGKTHREYFNYPKANQDPDKRKNTVKRMMLLALACKVITQDEIEAARKQGKGAKVDFTLCVGRHFCGELQAEEYEGKKRCKLGYRIWAVDSEEAKGIPVNHEELAKQGDEKEDVFGDLGADDKIPF